MKLFIINVERNIKPAYVVADSILDAVLEYENKYNIIVKNIEELSASHSFLVSGE